MLSLSKHEGKEKKRAPEFPAPFFFLHCHGPQMRAIQMTPPFYLQDNREPNWMTHAEFTLRPRFTRTGVVGDDS